MDTAEKPSGGERRVLIVTYSYPPTGAYGSVRPLNLAKYLPSYGWRPTILTVGKEKTRWSGGDEPEANLPGVKVIRAPFPDILTNLKSLLLRLGVLKAAGPGAETRLKAAASQEKNKLVAVFERAMRWAKRWASFPDRYLLWFPFAFALGLKELRANDYDVIFSTSPPVMDHLLAATFQRLTGVPWVADYRDPWSQKPLLEFTPFEFRVTRALEKRVMSGARAIVTVSEPLAEMLMDLHGDRAGGVISITNAYDPEDYEGEVELLKDKFVITYAGMLYGSKRDPGEFLGAVEELMDEGAIRPEELLIRFYGPYDPVVHEARAALKYPQVLEINDAVRRCEVMKRERESTALLILVWDHPYTALGYGGKVFEYLGSRRPILAWNPTRGVLVELLEKTNSGVSASSAEELRSVLRAWFEEYKKTGTLEFKGNQEEIERFGWDRNAGLMAEVLAGVIGSPQS